MSQPSREQQIAALEKDWAENPRWKGIKRNYTAADVVRLRGSLQIEHTLAKRGAEKLWNLLNTEPFVNSLGALTGNQAMQQVKAGLKAIYLSGWQVAGDANSNGEMYPDQSLYAVDSVPKVVKRINATFKRADEIQWSEGKNDIDFFAPIVADAEAVVERIYGVKLDLSQVTADGEEPKKKFPLSAIFKGQYGRRLIMCSALYLAVVTPLYALLTFLPAILKGWMERTLVPTVAFRLDDKGAPTMYEPKVEQCVLQVVSAQPFPTGGGDSGYDRIVMNPPFSDVRKATPRAISSAMPSRPTGILATIFSSTGAGTAATMSVSI